MAETPDSQELAVVEGTIAEMKRADPTIQRYFDEAYGYAIFPSVGEGAFVVGGARGTGWVFEQGVLVGEATLTEVSVGAQAGGQRFAQIIFFEDAVAMDAFKAGRTELGAEVSAVALTERAALKTGYDPNGMAIFVLPRGGLIADVSVGGQRFSFRPLEQ